MGITGPGFLLFLANQFTVAKKGNIIKWEKHIQAKVLNISGVHFLVFKVKRMD